MTESTELVVIAPETALEVYTADKGLDPYLDKIKKEVESFIPDISSKKGRDAIASMAYKVSQSKTYLDKTGKELVDKLKEQPKLVDAERKRMRDYLDALRDDVRKPLTDWETAEEERIAAIKKRLYSIELRLECSDLDSDELQSNIDSLTSLPMDESWQEFHTQAIIAKDRSIEALKTQLIKRKAYEAEQAELAILRQEAAEREQKEREERIAREAAEAERLKAELAAQAERQRVEAEAQAERDAVAKREAEAKAEADRKELELTLAAERAKREALEAEQRAVQAAQAERDKIAAEKAAEAAELAKREKDKAHKKDINNAAVAAFTNGGMTEECAKLAVTLIAKKAIPAIVINY
jgi:peptidoglycan DL-endopeptidase RipA